MLSESILFKYRGHREHGVKSREMDEFAFSGNPGSGVSPIAIFYPTALYPWFAPK